MKRFIQVIYFILLPTLLLSQQVLIPRDSHPPATICGTVAPTGQARIELEQAMTRVAALRNAGTDCIPIKFHVVRKNNGTGGATLQQLAIGIANLNHIYLDAGLEFFICGSVDYINDSDFYNFNTNSPDSDVEGDFCDSVDNMHALNVYIVESITLGSFQAAGYASFPSDNIQSTRIFMIIPAISDVPNGTFIHELGHTFGLYHTFQFTAQGPDSIYAENVARTGSCMNCDMTGDLLCDTDADPNSSQVSNCVYTGSEMDECGVIYTPPISNIMSYYPDVCGLGSTFTAGQFSRIISGYQLRLTHSAYDFSCSPASVTAPTLNSATFDQASQSVILSWTDNASNELGYLIERSSTSASSGFRNLPFGGVAPDVESFEDVGIQDFTTYYYRLKAVNGDCNTYSNVVSVSVGTVYCNPFFGITCTNVHIDEFNITDSIPLLSNTGTGCSSDGGSPSHNYANYTGSVASVTLEAGHTYAWNLKDNPSDTLTYIGFTGIFIDYNADGDFSDGGEILYHNTMQFTGSLSDSISIDTAASTGNTVLRVRVSNNTEITNACMNTYFGEIEDYEVDIVNNIPPIDATNGCTSVTVNNVQGDSFYLFQHNGNIIAAINPNGQNLGDVTIQVNKLTSVQMTMNGNYYVPRNWTITSTDSPSSNVTVQFYVLDSELDAYNAASGLNFNYNDLVISWYENSGSEDCDFSNNDLSQGTEGTVASAGTIYNVGANTGFYHQFQIDHFTEFGMGEPDILPVEFLSFNVELIKSSSNVEAAKLTWAVVENAQCESYQIEKSTDKLNFYPIGERLCSVNKNGVATYNFIDNNIRNNHIYYRIKQWDVDGDYIYTAISTLHIDLPEGKIFFYPNPVSDILTIQVSEELGIGGQVEMYNLMGQRVYSRQVSDFYQPYRIPCSEFHTGIYYVIVRLNNGGQRQEKVLISR